MSDTHDTPILMDGKALSLKIQNELNERLDKLRPFYSDDGLCLIIYTNSDPASQVYVRNKLRFAEAIGVTVLCRNLYEELSIFYNSHGKSCRFSGNTFSPYIIQLPLDQEVRDMLDLEKDDEIFDYFDGDIDRYDMDGFNCVNMGRLFLGQKCVKPCTPAGILRLLDEYNVSWRDKRVAIFGRSNIVGKPLAQMMMKEGATVTNIHTKTPFYEQLNIVRNSDIVVSATGNRDAWKNFRVQDLPDVVVDVGMNRDENGKLCGDVPTELLKFCTHVTPVPGGVGPMTVAMLFENVVSFYEEDRERWGRL